MLHGHEKGCMLSTHETKKSTNCKSILQNYSDDGPQLLKMKRLTTKINQKCSLPIKIVDKSCQNNRHQKHFLFYYDVSCMANLSHESFHMNSFYWYPIKKPSKPGGKLLFFLVLLRTMDMFGRYCGHI